MFRRVVLLAALAAHAGAFAPPLGVMPLRLQPAGTLAAKSQALRAHMPRLGRRGGAGPRMVTQEMAEAASQAASQLGSTDPSTLLAFADQGQNLAGKFFQASLLPYLGFLYWLQNPANGTPKMVNFGFRFLLLFVIATIPTGIISKTQYGMSLADVDWLHGGAELLLTVTNLLIVYGLRQAIATGEADKMNGTVKNAALAVLAGVAVFAAVGNPLLHLEAHTPFLAGLGNLPASWMASIGLPTEPVNGLSIPTWAIHFSSVYEWIFAMGLVWKYADVTKNPAWRGLTWGMLPLHASGIAACTYHFWYNAPELSFLVALQAGLTFVGNTTVAIAALRIALSNGWNVPFLGGFEGGGGEEMKEEAASAPLIPDPSVGGESEGQLLLKLSGLTLISAYATKYGELALGFPFTPNAAVAALMVAAPPTLLAFQYWQKSQEADAEAAK